MKKIGFILFVLIFSLMSVCVNAETFTYTVSGNDISGNSVSGNDVPGNNADIEITFEMTGSVPASYKAACPEPGIVIEVPISDIISDNTRDIKPDRYIYVYLPYGYTEDNAYPVVYHSGGKNSVFNDLMDQSLFKNVLDNMIYKQDILPVVFVVIPDKSFGRTMSFKNYTDEIMGYVEETYTIDAEKRIIGGFSQGAYAVWDIMTRDCSIADCYIPISPFYYTGWNYKSLIRRIGDKDIYVFNSIGEYECGPLYPYDGLIQLDGIRSAMSDFPNAGFYVIKNALHDQNNCMQAYYKALMEFIPYE